MPHSSVVPVNTVPGCTAPAMVRKRLSARQHAAVLERGCRGGNQHLRRDLAGLRDDLVRGMEHRRRGVATLAKLIPHGNHNLRPLEGKGANGDGAGRRHSVVLRGREHVEVFIDGDQQGIARYANALMGSLADDSESSTGVEAGRPITVLRQHLPSLPARTCRVDSPPGQDSSQSDMACIPREDGSQAPATGRPTIIDSSRAGGNVSAVWGSN
jgi:hypothetical protein